MLYWLLSPLVPSPLLQDDLIYKMYLIVCAHSANLLCVEKLNVFFLQKNRAAWDCLVLPYAVWPWTVTVILLCVHLSVSPLELAYTCLLMNNKCFHWLYSKPQFHNLLLFLLTSVYLSTINEKISDMWCIIGYSPRLQNIKRHWSAISHIHMGTFKIKFPNDCFFNIVKTHFTTS